MPKKIGTSLMVLLPMVFGATPSSHAARLCKDGYVTYTGSALALSKRVAEANAIRAWRRAGTQPFKDTAPLTNVRCVQNKGAGTWRCFVRAGRCALT